MNRQPSTERSPEREGLRRRDFIRTGLCGLIAIAWPSPGFALETSGDFGPVVKAPREGSVRFGDEEWVGAALKKMWQDHLRTGMTPLLEKSPPFQKDIQLYFKNEAKSPTGSLKHRVAWALVMYGLVNGDIQSDTRLYEATSGNTGIAEAYFASLIGLNFTAVLRSTISRHKIEAVKQYGGEAALAPQGKPVDAHLKDLLRADPKSYDLNQFANAEKALDYFSGTPAENMNVANEIFKQMELEPHPCPAWIITGAGTGGTATSIARYIRKWTVLKRNPCPTRLAVVDPEYSVLFDWYLTGDESLTLPVTTRVEGIGSSGPVVFGRTFSLLRKGVSRMVKVPDRASLAAMHLASDLAGFAVGPSTGTNFFGALRVIKQMRDEGKPGSVVTLICDEGSRYKDTYYNPDWVKENGLGYDEWLTCLRRYWEKGEWVEPSGA